jgi:hypothetical protein
MIRLTTVLMTRGLFKWRAAAIGCALAALGGVAKCRNGAATSIRRQP